MYMKMKNKEIVTDIYYFDFYSIINEKLFPKPIIPNFKATSGL